MTTVRSSGKMSGATVGRRNRSRRRRRRNGRGSRSNRRSRFEDQIFAELNTFLQSFHFGRTDQQRLLHWLELLLKSYYHPFNRVTSDSKEEEEEEGRLLRSGSSVASLSSLISSFPFLSSFFFVEVEKVGASLSVEGSGFFFLIEEEGEDGAERTKSDSSEELEVFFLSFFFFRECFARGNSVERPGLEANMT